MVVVVRAAVAVVVGLDLGQGAAAGGPRGVSSSSNRRVRCLLGTCRLLGSPAATCRVCLRHTGGMWSTHAW